ncbi:MAG: hypothetical protein J6O17_03475 [Eubacterium sp.]|nr:hypothetical protein [Eubacterium sp.]
MNIKTFCKNKFNSMLISGTFTMAVLYLMMLSDSIIAGHFIGEKGIAAINAITPITGISTFFGCMVSTGSSIVYSQDIGAMRKKHADQIYGQGLIVTIVIGIISAVILYFVRDLYFSMSGVAGEIYDRALEYYKLTPINIFLTVLVYYLEDMVFSDGDELINNLGYIFQIGGNIVCSVILAKHYGMLGIIIGSIIGNGLGIIVSLIHFFRKCNTLHFVWYFNIKEFIKTARFSIVDAVIYLCWSAMDYVLISYVSAHYGETGLITLAIVVSLIEFGVVLDGVGMAIQPLLGTYLGEKNHVLIKRLMRMAVKAAVLEGVIVNVLVIVFAKQFCALFGITSGTALAPSIAAVRIVSCGLIFCSTVSLFTSYYMLIEHIGLSVAVTVLKDGILYSFLPIFGSVIAGENGMWIAFIIAPIVTLIISLAYIYLRYGKELFPYLIKDMDSEILVFDDVLTKETATGLSEKVEKLLEEHNYPKGIVNKAALFVEEIGLTILEQNKKEKKKLFIELSVVFEEKGTLIIERDSGIIFDITDPDQKIEGLSGFILSGLMEAHEEKAYLTTTGYNRNMMRFPLKKS